MEKPISHDHCATEIAVLIGRAIGSQMFSGNDGEYMAGCLAKLALKAGVEPNHVKQIIAPITLEKALFHVGV